MNDDYLKINSIEKIGSAVRVDFPYNADNIYERLSRYRTEEIRAPKIYRRFGVSKYFINSFLEFKEDDDFFVHVPDSDFYTMCRKNEGDGILSDVFGQSFVQFWSAAFPGVLVSDAYIKFFDDHSVLVAPEKHIASYLSLLK